MLRETCSATMRTLREELCYARTVWSDNSLHLHPPYPTLPPNSLQGPKGILSQFRKKGKNYFVCG